MEWSFDYNGLFDKDNGEKKDKTMKKPKSKKKKKKGRSKKKDKLPKGSDDGGNDYADEGDESNDEKVQLEETEKKDKGKKVNNDTQISELANNSKLVADQTQRNKSGIHVSVGAGAIAGNSSSDGVTPKSETSSNSVTTGKKMFKGNGKFS
jgi:hypothetical protein